MSLVPKNIEKQATKEYSNKVPKKVKKLVKAYNKSKFYQPFKFAMDMVLDSPAEKPEWDDISKSDQEAIVEIARAIEQYGS